MCYLRSQLDKLNFFLGSLLAANIFFIIFSIALHFAGTGVFDNQFGTLNLVVDHNLSYLREAIWKIHFWPEVGLLDVSNLTLLQARVIKLSINFNHTYAKRPLSFA